MIEEMENGPHSIKGRISKPLATSYTDAKDYRKGSRNSALPSLRTRAHKKMLLVEALANKDKEDESLSI